MACGFRWAVPQVGGRGMPRTCGGERGRQEARGTRAAGRAGVSLPGNAAAGTTVGLDLAKNLFQVHGTDAQGRAVLKRRLAREKVLEFFANLPPCLVGLEACAAAHHWAGELAKLGHEVRLMPPQYVRPYVKTNKHDAADAEAICEAVRAARHAVRAGQERGPAVRC